MTVHLTVAASGRWLVVAESLEYPGASGGIIVDLDTRRVSFRDDTQEEFDDVDLRIGTAGTFDTPGRGSVMTGTVREIHRIDHLEPILERLAPIAAEYGVPERDVLYWLHRPTTAFRDHGPALRHLDDPDLIVEAARATWGIQW